MNASARAVRGKFAPIRGGNQIRHALKFRSSSANQIALAACRRRPILLQGDRGRDDAGVTAWVDQVEWCKVSSDIEGKPVPGNATLHAHADGANLTLGDPATRRTISSLRCNSERRTRGN
jgi:hypothetical protein